MEFEPNFMPVSLYFEEDCRCQILKTRLKYRISLQIFRLAFSNMFSIIREKQITFKGGGYLQIAIKFVQQDMRYMYFEF